MNAETAGGVVPLAELAAILPFSIYQLAALANRGDVPGAFRYAGLWFIRLPADMRQELEKAKAEAEKRQARTPSHETRPPP